VVLHGPSVVQGQQVLGLTDTQQEVYYQFLQPIGAASPVPNSIVQGAGPIHSDSRIKMDLGLYHRDIEGRALGHLAVNTSHFRVQSVADSQEIKS